MTSVKVAYYQKQSYETILISLLYLSRNTSSIILLAEVLICQPKNVLLLKSNYNIPLQVQHCCQYLVHMVSFLMSYGRLLRSQKNVLRGGSSFFHFKWGGVHMGGLAKISCKGGFNFKKLDCILVLFFVNLVQLVSCITLIVLSHVYITIQEHKFPKFKHDQRVIYVQNSFLYFEYDDSFT